MRYFHSLIVLLFLISSCAAPVAIISTPPELQYVQICTEYDPAVTEDLREHIEEGINQFVISHNSSAPSIKAKGCKDFNDPYTLNMHFGPAEYVGSRQNLAATAGNVVGIVGIPVLMAASGSTFILGFYFWPNTKTPVMVNVTDELLGSAGHEFPWVIKTPGYFNSIEKQNKKQGEGVYRILDHWFKNIEKQYEWEQKKLNRHARQ